MVLISTQEETVVWMILEDHGNHSLKSKAQLVLFGVFLRAITCTIQREALRLQMRSEAVSLCCLLFLSPHSVSSF